MRIRFLESAPRDCSLSSPRVGRLLLLPEAIAADFFTGFCIVLRTVPATSATRQFSELSMAVFADALKPEKFSGVHFKRWQIKCTLWLEAMHVLWVSKGKPEGISQMQICRGSDLYIMESFHDFKMVNDKSIVQQAHYIQYIAKELKILKYSLPDPFVAGCIIAKLPSLWRSFATALKHKRTNMSVEELIASLDVEEKARTKDIKGGEGHSVANTVQNQRNQGKGKGKFKPNKTTNFEKKKNKAELPCFTCGELGHFSKDCPERADRRGKRGGNGQLSKTVNTVTRDCSVLIGNGSAVSVLGTGTVDPKFTSGKIVQLKNVQHVPSMNKNLISGSLLLRDGFKVVLESNKVVVSRHGLFIGKGYVSGGLFRLSLSDFSNKCVNHICGGINDDASLWYGHLCHVNFGHMKKLSSMSSIPSFTFAKGSKCHSCVQSKQPRKPHKAAEPRNLAPLELIHSDLYEMNGMLTKGGKRIPNKNKDKTTYEEWIGRKPSLSYLRTWGCLAKVNVPINKKRKLGPKTVDCIFLGYAHQSIAYRFLVVKSDVPDMYVDTIMESRDATFFENIFPMKDMHSTSRFSSEITPELNARTEVFEPPREINPEEDNNEAPRKSKRQRVEKFFGNDFIVYLVDDTPTSISEAYASPDADNWKEAVQSELDSILSNGTWELTERRPYGCKPVGCKWVFKKKLRPDGTIEKYNARLVAKGYTQKECEDFFDTYLPVARMTTIRVLFFLAVSYGLIIHQMDVKTAFLNGELEEKIYMEQPDGFVVKGQESKFDMKDLGEADVILNVKLIKDESGITLSQTHYVEKVLSRFGYIDSKPSPTPYDPSVTLKKNKRIGVNQLKYSQIIGSLMYLASATRPDISFAVSKLSRFMSNPGHPAVLEGYNDTNCISDDELYATSGYVFMFGGGAVSWRSCKQTILTRSTMEAELAALDTAFVEADWLRELLRDLPVVEKPIPAILMNCDNQTAIAKVNSDKENAKSSRHVRRRVKSVRKMRHSGVISVTYIQTEKNLADPFTKGLSRNVIDIASREMGLRPI
ncbi:hypothetical protein U9M48_004964 [Paspalum notatum var. saurae]|uniref:CCHC-type domain-containing protein n=1 Tax=Paspalum notatum var. saurae TaxID=547442 RepID=A0AAQ3SLL8_PASNO